MKGQITRFAVVEQSDRLLGLAGSVRRHQSPSRVVLPKVEPATTEQQDRGRREITHDGRAHQTDPQTHDERRRHHHQATSVPGAHEPTGRIALGELLADVGAEKQALAGDER
jgi:hypothetical protein